MKVKLPNANCLLRLTYLFIRHAYPSKNCNLQLETNYCLVYNFDAITLFHCKVALHKKACKIGIYFFSSSSQAGISFDFPTYAFLGPVNNAYIFVKYFHYSFFHDQLEYII
uniref:Uncharacterized protein n=1 Tax=Pyxicephalus adspersus TaxID=30357 RepID=A0AAV3AZ98_PYXAD|nr:TPA: hypothetical protein GDO54_001902 [Pyxicephalus adspersus]